MTAKLLPITARDYHADFIDPKTPSLSSHAAKVLVNESAYKCWLGHPKLGNVGRESTDTLDRGTLIHALVYGTFDPGEYEVIQADNYRKAATQEARDTAIASGKIPMLAREFASAKEQAGAIREAITAAGVDLATGFREQPVRWTEETAHGPILCRGMMDHLDPLRPTPTVWDLKTCQSAHPNACKSHVLKYGYDIQAAAYLSAAEKLYPDLVGRFVFRWLFVEELPAGSPQKVALTVASPAATMLELGQRKWRRACELWAECLKTNHWPGYAPGVVDLEAPMWAVTEEMSV